MRGATNRFCVDTLRFSARLPLFLPLSATAGLVRASKPGSATKLERGVAAAAILLIVSFHLAFWFAAGPLWRDEVNTLQFADWPSLHKIWDSLQYDSFP